MDAGACASRLSVDTVLGPCDPLLQSIEERAIYDVLPVDAAYLRIWQPQAALMVTAAEAGLPRFATAAQRARDRGLPVQIRASGGGAVCLGPGTLVVSHLYSSPNIDIDTSYRSFTASLTAAIAAVGIDLSAQRVAGAYCDGRYDLAWRGRKVGGMAQRRRVSPARVRVWIHAVVSIDAASLDYPAEVTRFYADLRLARVADPAAATTLAHCLPGGSGDDLLRHTAGSIADTFQRTLNPTSFRSIRQKSA